MRIEGSNRRGAAGRAIHHLSEERRHVAEKCGSQFLRRTFILIFLTQEPFSEK
jgi:hypothetical protein